MSDLEKATDNVSRDLFNAETKHIYLHTSARSFDTLGTVFAQLVGEEIKICGRYSTIASVEATTSVCQEVPVSYYDKHKTTEDAWKGFEASKKDTSIRSLELNLPFYNRNKWHAIIRAFAKEFGVTISVYCPPF
jgi:hypothetical protein